MPLGRNAFIVPYIFQYMDGNFFVFSCFSLLFAAQYTRVRWTAYERLLLCICAYARRQIVSLLCCQGVVKGTGIVYVAEY